VKCVLYIRLEIDRNRQKWECTRSHTHEFTKSAQTHMCTHMHTHTHTHSCAHIHTPNTPKPRDHTLVWPCQVWIQRLGIQSTHPHPHPHPHTHWCGLARCGSSALACSTHTHIPTHLGVALPGVDPALWHVAHIAFPPLILWLCQP